MATGFGKAVSAQLLAAASKGQRPAQQELYLTFAEPAYHLCLGILGSEAMAEDAVQNAFIKAFKGLHGLNEVKAFGGWLKRICTREALDLLKDEVPGDGADLVLVLADDNWLSAADALSSLDDLERLMSCLNAQERALVWLHCVEGMSHGELAEMMVITEVACRQKYRRALSRLAERAQRWEVGHDSKTAL